MRSRRLMNILILAVTALFVMAGPVAAKDKKPKKKEKTQQKEELPPELQRKFELVFLEAERQQLAGNHSDAFELYTYALQLNPASSVAHYKLSQYYLFLRDEARAERSLKKAVEESPDNLWYKESLAVFYEQHNQLNQAIGVIESMVPLSKEKSELLMELVELYTLQSSDITLQVTNYGARVASLWTKDSQGKMENIVVGHDNLQDYITPPGERFLGATVGPVANRIGNASFDIDGVVYHTPANDHDKNTLHGGFVGTDHLVWGVKEVCDTAIVLTLELPDGQEGFPGNCTVTVTYTLTEDDALEML